MDNLEKVEKLRERANVSYEEAKEALENNDWDLLDAMVALEKEGKTVKPEQTAYSTSYEEQAITRLLRRRFLQVWRRKKRESRDFSADSLTYAETTRLW